MSKHEITVLEWSEVEDIGYWTPSHGLEQARKALAAGKRAVFLGACDCGCWTEEKSAEARAMAASLGDDGPVYHNLVCLSKGRPVIILPKELRRDSSHCAMSLKWSLDLSART